MSTAVTQPRAESRRALASALGVLAVSGLVFIAGFALPYLTLDQERFAGFWPIRGWLLVHIAAGIGALLSGPLQLWWGLTDRRMETHRKLGIAYVACVAIGAVSGIPLAIYTERGVISSVALLGLVLAWALTTGMAFLAIRRHLHEQHKEWMIRSYVVTFAFVTARIGVGVFSVGLGAPPGTADFNTAFAIALWLSWTVPLLVTEVILQGRKILAVRA
ncbi:MAG: DUF2306 domain-containing protein [Acidimicrobiia bacterium]|nr:DUF2306 domain-containing protein [Acidimicrobiia bacterium]